MEIQTHDTEFIARLIASGWERSYDAYTFYWPTKRMPRC
jgi:hypothetical protein